MKATSYRFSGIRAGMQGVIVAGGHIAVQAPDAEVLGTVPDLKV